MCNQHSFCCSFPYFLLFFGQNLLLLYSVIFGTGFLKAFYKYEALTHLSQSNPIIIGEMVNGNCCIAGCMNSCFTLKKWEKQACKEYAGQMKKYFPCERPFTLQCFQSTLKNNEKRAEWRTLAARLKRHCLFKPLC